MGFDSRDAEDIASLRNVRRPWVTRLLFRLFARRINVVVYKVLGRAFERGVINSYQLHELCAHFDSTQRGVVGILSGNRAA